VTAAALDATVTTAPDVVTWHRGRRVAATCSVCGAAGDVDLVLSVHDAAPPHVLRHLHRCHDCHSLFMLPRDRVAYEHADQAGFSIKFYVEKGAGIDVMLGPLARVPFSGATRYLEIGCSFGFSLDFLRWRHGLAGTGVDPSPLAAAGREQLGLNVISAYFDDALAARLGPQDVIYCSELIEHVDDPAAFLRVAASGLGPGGMLVLTTPSVAAVAEGVAPTTVLAALSPGAHLAVFSRDGLQRLLSQAGLHHHVIEEGPETTLVWASADARPVLSAAPDDLGQAFGDYFEERLRQCAGRPALASGFLYRAFKQRMITGDAARAGALLPALRDFFRATYAVDLDAPDSWPVPDGRDVRAFIDDAPLNLPVVAHHLGVWLLNHGGDPLQAARTLVAASNLARQYRDILIREHIADGELNATISDAARAAVLALRQIPAGPEAAGWIGPAIAAAAEGFDDGCADADTRRQLALLALVHGGDDSQLRALIDAAAPGTGQVRLLVDLGLHQCNGDDPAETRATVMQALGRYARLAGHATPDAPLPPPAAETHADLRAALVDLLVALARQNLARGTAIEEAGAILLACRSQHPACDDLLALQQRLLADAWIGRFAAAPDATAAALAEAAAGRVDLAPAIEAVFRDAIFTGQYPAADLLAAPIEATIAGITGEIAAEHLPLLVAWTYYLLNTRHAYAAALALLTRIGTAGDLGEWAGPVSSALAIAQANTRG
jgi:SAM-dependent methyltransferase